MIGLLLMLLVLAGCSLPFIAIEYHFRRKRIALPVDFPDEEVTKEYWRAAIANDPPWVPGDCSTRDRGWMQTYSGTRFYPLDPRAEDVELADLAHGLAMTCRYAGHANRFYSVAEHCVLVSEHVESLAMARCWPHALVVAVSREALLHDSAEAYIGDMIRPLKHQPEMQEFRNAEAKIEACVFQRFGIQSTEQSHKLIKEVDDRILRDEVVSLKTDPSMYNELMQLEPLGASITGWQPMQAKARFMARYRELFDVV